MNLCEWNQAAYMADQCHEICVHKWIESEKAGKDLGSEAVKDWIDKYAIQFREYAVNSGKYFIPAKNTNKPLFFN